MSLLINLLVKTEKNESLPLFGLNGGLVDESSFLEDIQRQDVTPFNGCRHCRRTFENLAPIVFLVITRTGSKYEFLEISRWIALTDRKEDCNIANLAKGYIFTPLIMKHNQIV